MERKGYVKGEGEGKEEREKEEERGHEQAMETTKEGEGPMIWLRVFALQIYD